jgi:hypothetical protein
MGRECQLHILGPLVIAVALGHGVAAAQNLPALPIRVLAEEPVGPSNFTKTDLTRVGIVLVAAKLPDAQVTEDAGLVLYLTTSCDRLSESVAACAFNVSLIHSLGVWKRAFGQPQWVMLWTTGSLVVAPPGGMLEELRRRLDFYLDAPVAAWRQLDTSERRCWTSFLATSPDGTQWAWTDTELPTDSGILMDAVFKMGPCRER